MAKRKPSKPELPLFDLPLHAEGEELPLHDDSTPGDATSDDSAAHDAATPDRADLDAAQAELAIEARDADEITLRQPVQTVLPDLVVEPPSKGRRDRGSAVAKQGAVGDSATSPRARLSEDGPMEDPEESDADGDEVILTTVAPLVERAMAGLADLGSHLVMLVIAALASHFVGIRLSFDLWPPFLGLGLVVSFLYWIIPLAFWGQTPGMAWLGNIARSFDGEPLSFGQALLRWLGALITVGLLGTPLLLTLWGRSLSDRLSDSKTLILADGDLDDSYDDRYDD